MYLLNFHSKRFGSSSEIHPTDSFEIGAGENENKEIEDDCDKENNKRSDEINEKLNDVSTTISTPLSEKSNESASQNSKKSLYPKVVANKKKTEQNC